mmetsp:Transcript_9901/g.31399  ORF Transcript_9901/g.31399 Transcript_9901/m.31399 type:complete len:334 (-) Transcript_9901:121-1122(-)
MYSRANVSGPDNADGVEDGEEHHEIVVDPLYHATRHSTAFSIPSTLQLRGCTLQLLGELATLRDPNKRFPAFTPKDELVAFISKHSVDEVRAIFAEDKAKKKAIKAAKMDVDSPAPPPPEPSAESPPSVEEEEEGDVVRSPRAKLSVSDLISMTEAQPEAALAAAGVKMLRNLDWGLDDKFDSRGKEDLIAVARRRLRIVRERASVLDELNEFCQDTASSADRENMLSDEYRAHFNMIDRFNAMSTRLSPKHTTKDWTWRLVCGVVSMALCNAWVLCLGEHESRPRLSEKLPQDDKERLSMFVQGIAEEWAAQLTSRPLGAPLRKACRETGGK